MGLHHSDTNKKVLVNGSDYIELDSVGSTLTSDLLVFPTDCSEAPETASDADEMSGVNVFECDDEWYYNLSLTDGWALLYFLDAHIGYTEEWKEKVNSLMGCQDTLSEVK